MQSPDDPEHGKDAAGAPGDLTFLHGSPRSSEPLPRGQHHLSPEYVASHQRTRIQEATTHVLAQRGYGPATIGDIVAHAHVSRRTFYDHFETKDHAVLSTFGASAACIADAVRAAYAAGVEWDASFAAGLSELVRILAEYPESGKICFVETRSVGAAAAEPLLAARVMATDALRRGLAERPGARALDDMALEMATGGLVTVIRDRLAADDPEALRRELPGIACALLEPLVGPEPTAAVVAHLDSGAQSSAAHAI